MSNYLPLKNVCRWGCETPATFTQGSSSLATLGFVTESLWDSFQESLPGSWHQTSAATAFRGRFARMLFATFAFLALLCAPHSARCGGTVANCTEADLNAALTDGGTVT